MKIFLKDAYTKGICKGPSVGWKRARIISVSRQEIAFVLEGTERLSGNIKIAIQATGKSLPFRAVCDAVVVRVTEQGDKQCAEVLAYVRRWEIKRWRTDVILNQSV